MNTKKHQMTHLCGQVYLYEHLLNVKDESNHDTKKRSYLVKSRVIGPTESKSSAIRWDVLLLHYRRAIASGKEAWVCWIIEDDIEGQRKRYMFLMNMDYLIDESYSKKCKYLKKNELSLSLTWNDNCMNLDRIRKDKNIIFREEVLKKQKKRKMIDVLRPD